MQWRYMGLCLLGCVLCHTGRANAAAGTVAAEHGLVSFLPKRGNDRADRGALCRPDQWEQGVLQNQMQHALFRSKSSRRTNFIGGATKRSTPLL